MSDPKRRIELLKELGVNVTEEMKEAEYKHSLDTVERTYGATWEADADKLHELIHPVDEAYEIEKSMDDEDMEALHDYLDEGTGNHNADDVRADMVGNL